MKSKTTHYISGKAITEELNKYYKAKQQAIAEDKPLPVISNSIGEGVKKIAQNLLRSPKFRKVPQAEHQQMITAGEDSAFNAIMKKYDPEKMKSGSAFSFLTQAIYFGFLGAIQRSKKEFDGKNIYMNAFANGQVMLNSYDTDTSFRNYHGNQLSELRKLTDEYESDKNDLTLDYVTSRDMSIRDDWKRIEYILALDTTEHKKKTISETKGNIDELF